MSEEKKLTSLQQFIKDKPIPEDIIAKCLDDEKKNNALDFVAWLRENKLSLRISRSSPHLWEAKYKSKTLCHLSINHAELSLGDWGVGIVLTNMDKYSEIIMNKGLQNIIWNGTSYCRYGERSPYFGMAKAPGCNPKKLCIPGKTINVLGNDIKYCCVDANGKLVRFTNPDEITLFNTKTLLTLEKEARNNTAV